MIRHYIDRLNSSRFFAGVLMLVLNIGSKYIDVSLTSSQQAYLRGSLARQLLVFAVAFAATKDIVTSLVLTGVFHMLSYYLLNEESSLCIIPENWKQLQEYIDEDNDSIITDNEINKAIRVLEDAKRQRQKREHLLLRSKFGF